MYGDSAAGDFNNRESIQHESIQAHQNQVYRGR